ncbi:thymidylate kinase [Geobacter sp. OR-1]|uniref:dTMP kinase n=1 Tax=Geobacter sp. OR-1 TaxID=1266765 RepID=UPI000541AA7F|nr:dTMP kinase [Geobacter sp. OR-1]GAM08199.1 thymidylate kinase [Geobacter sp. OR-1]
MGCFITFEGIEGCGKTTQINLLAIRLNELGYETVVTREPGGCPISDQIRSILLNGNNNAMEPLAELLLYAAARAQHVSEVISPALEADKIVLCDRFTDATLAYQGFARGLDKALIENLNQLASFSIRPHMTFLFDCPVEIGLSRAISPLDSQGVREDRFEKESLAFHQRVRDGYIGIAGQAPDRIIIIPADRQVQAVADDVFAAVMARIQEDR